MILKTLRFLLICVWVFLVIFVTGETILVQTSLAHYNYIAFLMFAGIVGLHARYAKRMSAKAVLANYLGSLVVISIWAAVTQGWINFIAMIPNFLFWVLGMISGYISYICWQQQSYKKLAFPVIFLGLALLHTFVFFPHWIQFVRPYLPTI